MLSGAPFGYRYVRKSEHADARYEVVAHEAAVVTELFTRYADGGVAIGELARPLSGLGVITRTGKPRWDRPTVWGMLVFSLLGCAGPGGYSEGGRRPYRPLEFFYGRPNLKRPTRDHSAFFFPPPSERLQKR